MSLERANVIDALGIDEPSGRVVLVIRHEAPWDGSDQQLFLLQEKLNAYLSFALDGEMAEAYPELSKLPLRIQIDCAAMPEGAALEFLNHVHDQIAFQNIKLEVRVMGAGGCGPGCGCAA